ncbi:GNAT family N-acetyltransferase [Priestia megaterium]|uniref:GNAT family N-acetyltransferase n=1 Tax=Priestia megaterium TaxID=1404 RepID=UPI0034E212B5
MSLEWFEITKGNTKYFEHVMKVHEETFPIEVRESKDIFLRSLEYSKTSFPNTFRFLVGIEDGKVVSFTTGHFLADVNTGFIVYIVTDPYIRSRGLGSKTLRKIEGLLNEDAIKAGFKCIDKIMLETETIEMVHTDSEKKDCFKRNKFFERNKYNYINFIDYKQPPLHKGEPSFPLNLFVKNYGHSETKKDFLYKAIISLYREKYFNVNGIDKETLNNCIEEMQINKQL